VTLLNDTFASNQAAGLGGGIACEWSGAGTSSTTTVSLQNTLVANSLAGSNFATSGTFASFSDAKNNLSDDASGAAFLTDASDFNSTPAKVAPSLQNNGGPTQTLALLAGSPAIGAGGAITSVVSSTPTTLTVADAAAIASKYFISVDGEEMEVTG